MYQAGQTCRRRVQIANCSGSQRATPHRNPSISLSIEHPWLHSVPVSDRNQIERGILRQKYAGCLDVCY